MKWLASIALAASALFVAAPGHACERDGLRFVVPVGIERLDAGSTNSKLLAAGYTALPAVRTSIGPFIDLQVTCNRLVFGGQLLRLFPTVHSSGPDGARASLGGGGIVGVDVGYLAWARSGWEVGPFASAELGLSYLTIDAPDGAALPAGVFRSQGRIDVPLHLGLRITKTLDTSSSSFFGYAEPGRQGAGPVIGIDVGVVITPGARWFDDSQGVGNPGAYSSISGLGSAGPFVRLVVGYGVWHEGKGPWSSPAVGD